MKGRNPTAAEKRHITKVGQLPCIVCILQGLGETPAAIHHVEGKTKPGVHFLVLPLCSLHHQNGGYGVALHAGKKEFERRYGTEYELLEKVNELIQEVA